MPNSLLWIGLVAVWLFVLVPMLVTKRPRIRQTTDAALATRVLHRGDDDPITPRGPAAGHRSDPNWRPSRDRRRAPLAADRVDSPAEDSMDTQELVDRDERPPEETTDRAPAREFVPERRGRGGFDPHADAVARAARYEFRQRAVLGLLFAAIMTAALALIVSSALWWLCALAMGALVGYMFYLRRQVRLEQEIRRRRMARLARSRLGVESRSDEELRLIPSRLRRPGAVVLEVDDEDPVFDHLDNYEDEFDVHEPRETREPSEYEVRRASGE
ncbi:gephyrin-like molybdotransferase receptor GlpR [Rhodococcus phenolicus]|uniref:divisome protein SepX/GlpR n=1 Tax=Rhodococcus phenolicus TaxID=263849 RepID=UPI0008299BC6|nr:gephyrin-like molybdotransferase receptor GlpR [Rhodococcus phenolicus]